MIQDEGSSEVMQQRKDRNGCRTSDCHYHFPQFFSAMTCLHIVAAQEHLFIQSILMHHPISAFSLRLTSTVVHKCVLAAHGLRVLRDGAVPSGGLPVAKLGSSIGSRPIGILPVPWAKEIPLLTATLQH